MDGIETKLKAAKTREEIHNIFDEAGIVSIKKRIEIMANMKGNPIDLCHCRHFTEQEKYEREVSIFLVFNWKLKSCYDKLAAEGMN